MDSRMFYGWRLFSPALCSCVVGKKYREWPVFSIWSKAIWLTLFLCFLVMPAQGQIRFQEVTAQAGIAHVGEAWGAAWGDFNNDGRPDIWAGNHRTRPTLYLNNGDATFTDITTQVWNTDQYRDTHGAAWADFDSNGLLDLFESTGLPALWSISQNNFYVNTGTALYENAEALGLGYREHRGRVPLWLDWDRDGFLDIIFTGPPACAAFHQSSGKFIDVTQQVKFNCSGSAQFATLSDVSGDGVMDVICHGNPFPQRIYDISNGKFNELRGVMPAVSSVTDAAVADFNGDLRTDLFLARSRGESSNAVLQDNVTVKARLAFGNSSYRGITFVTSGNLNLDFSASGSKSPIVYVGSSGWHPKKEDIVGPPIYRFSLSPDNPSVWGLKSYTVGVNDGVYIGYLKNTQKWQIVLVGTGGWRDFSAIIHGTAQVSNLSFINFTPKTPTAPVLLATQGSSFIDRTSFAKLNTPRHCNLAATGDFDNDMDVDIYLLCNNLISNIANVMYENQGNGTFTLVANSAGAPGSTEGLASNAEVADYDMDGFLDLFIQNGYGDPPLSNGPDQLYRNLGNNNHWIELDLEGSTSNRSAIGAQVLLTAGGVTQLREIGAMQFGQQIYHRLHFGLGDNTIVKNIVIRWPSGVIQEIQDIPADQITHLVEGAGSLLLSVNDKNVAEDSGSATFTVKLSAPSAQTVTVKYATADGTAKLPQDYTAVKGTLTFTPGITSLPVSVPIQDDQLAEGNETFRLILSNPVNATLSSSGGQATGTILDDEVSISPCGAPTYSAKVTAAAFVWRDCSTGQWFARFTSGGSPKSIKYIGTVTADTSFSTVSPYSNESTDILDHTTNPSVISYALIVVGAGQDGFEFTLPGSASACFGIDMPVGATALIGKSKTPVSLPFSLNTLGACGG